MTIEQVRAELQKLLDEFIRQSTACEQEGGDKPYSSREHAIATFSTWLDDRLAD